MVKSISYILCVCFLWLGCQQARDESLLIAVAANAKYALDEITLEFEAQEGIKCKIISNSSGMLCSQIMEGAPYDVFISANSAYTDYLFDHDFSKEKPVVFALGKLILWSYKQKKSLSIEDLAIEQIRSIAIPNPKNAPYGKAAMEAIKFYQMQESLTEKLVFGESVSQTNQFIHSNSADIGFTAKSVIFSKYLDNVGNWIEIDQNTYSPIEQTVICISKNKKPGKLALAKKFQQFLLSEKGKSILESFGYEIHNL